MKKTLRFIGAFITCLVLFITNISGQRANVYKSKYKDGI